MNAIWNPQLSPKLLTYVAVAFFIAVLGYSWPAFQGKGSPLGRYVESLESKTTTTHGTAAQPIATDAAPATTSPAPIAAPDRSLARMLDRVLAILCILLTALLPFYIHRHPGIARLYWIPALWILLHSVAATLHAAKVHAELSVPAHATRYLLPVALALLLWRPKTSKPLANGLLRVACASTFAIHGIEALQLAPTFQNLIYNFGAKLGAEIPSHVIHNLLYAIGFMDLLLAMSVLLVHQAALLRWMAFWGFITALARPVTMGWDTWHELAMRLANAFCPWLVLALGMAALLPKQGTVEPMKSTS